MVSGWSEWRFRLENPEIDLTQTGVGVRRSESSLPETDDHSVRPVQAHVRRVEAVCEGRNAARKRRPGFQSAHLFSCQAMKALDEASARAEFNLLCVGTWLMIAFYLVGVWTLVAFGVLLLSHRI